MKRKICIGFQETKNKCKNFVGSKWESEYFCQECDEKRIEHVDKGMANLAKHFGLDFQPFKKAKNE